MTPKRSHKTHQHHVLFDDQIFLLQKYGGISRYFCELAKRLSALNWKASVSAAFHQNRHLVESYTRSSPCGLGGFRGKFLSYLPPASYRLFHYANSLHLRRSIRFRQPDILHYTYYNREPTRRINATQVLTVYDMIHEKFPESFRESKTISRLKLRAVRKADFVFCISSNTQRDLLDITGIKQEKTAVIPLGCDGFSLKPSSTSLVDRPYILHVGHRAGYKNFSCLAEAFFSSRVLKRDFQLVAFGGPAIAAPERRQLQSMGADEKNFQHFTGDDRILASLYKFATIFVYPSLYEGFGIPPLEAMSLMCPVVCSNTSSLPEVVGDAALTFDPSSPLMLRIQLEHLLSDNSLKERLVARGKQRQMHFSWDTCANKTNLMYDRLVDG